MMNGCVFNIIISLRYREAFQFQLSLPISNTTIMNNQND